MKNFDISPKHRLWVHVLKSTHNLCLKAKIGKIMFTPANPLYYIKVGCKEVYISMMFSDCDLLKNSYITSSDDFSFDCDL